MTFTVLRNSSQVFGRISFSYNLSDALFMMVEGLCVRVVSGGRRFRCKVPLSLDLAQRTRCERDVSVCTVAPRMAESMSDSFLCCNIALPFFSFSILCSLEGNPSMYPTYKEQRIISHLPMRAKYLYKSYRNLNRKFVSSFSFIYLFNCLTQCGPMDVYFMLWLLTSYYFINFVAPSLHWSFSCWLLCPLDKTNYCVSFEDFLTFCH